MTGSPLTPELMRRLADARSEYTSRGDGPFHDPIVAEADLLRVLANVMDGDISVRDLVASLSPSWRWPDFPEFSNTDRHMKREVPDG